MEIAREVASGLLASPIAALISRGGKATQRWVVAKIPSWTALRHSERQCQNLRASLTAAIQDFGVAYDYVLQLDPNNGPFDVQRVLIETHTKRLFKAALPVILHSTRETNTLHVGYGRAHGVIAGMILCVTSRLGNYSEKYVLQEKDITTDHLCLRPAGLDLSKVRVEDLIVSFVPLANLTEYERSISLVLDVVGSAADKYRDVLTEACR